MPSCRKKCVYTNCILKPHVGRRGGGGGGGGMGDTLLSFSVLIRTAADKYLLDKKNIHGMFTFYPRSENSVMRACVPVCATCVGGAKVLAVDGR
jgi:hypothetical protein